MARRILPPKLKVSKFEATLLSYPPNVDTWICRSETCNEEGGIVNGGVKNHCWVCGTPMSDEPEFAWPLYVSACKKVGIVPGESLWRYNSYTKVAVVKDIFEDSGWKLWDPDPPVRLEVASRR